MTEEARAERLATGRLRRRATIARKGIVQILETTAEYGFVGDEWQSLAEDTAVIARAVKAAQRLEDMEAGVKALEAKQTAARERLEVLLQLVNSDPKQPENRPHQYKYNRNPNPNQDTVDASKRRSEAGPGIPSSSAAPPRSDKAMVHGIAPDEIVRLAPRLKLYLLRPSPTWPELVDAADWLRYDLGVSKPLWGDACAAMGRELAAVALAIVSTKDPEHFRTTPGGYFHGMVAKAKAGELHLERSVWAMRRAANGQADPNLFRGGGMPRR